MYKNEKKKRKEKVLELIARQLMALVLPNYFLLFLIIIISDNVQWHWRVTVYYFPLYNLLWAVTCHYLNFYAFIFHVKSFIIVAEMNEEHWRGPVQQLFPLHLFINYKFSITRFKICVQDLSFLFSILYESLLLPK